MRNAATQRNIFDRRRTSRRFDHELRLLLERLLGMTHQLDEMIARSIRALVTGDAALAEATIELDHRVNAAELAVDDHALRLLATRPLLTSDLQFITVAMKMVTDLERVGDLCVNICERVLDLGAAGQADVHAGIPSMAAHVRAMLRDSIDAFVDGDPRPAEAVVDRGGTVSAMYHAIFSDFVMQMNPPSLAPHPGIHVLSVAKWLERMGDHATSLAEKVSLLLRGEPQPHASKFA